MTNKVGPYMSESYEVTESKRSMKAPFQPVTIEPRLQEHKSRGQNKNRIETSKYSVLSFLPMNLFEQFSRAANLYFLFIAILQLVPGLSPTHWFTTVGPLVLVLGLNMIKEIYDDYHRHRSDHQVNESLVEVLAAGREEGEESVKVKCQHIAPGDIVKVRCDQEIPADLLFLASDHSQGYAYVETSNLDGETNLKAKSAMEATAGCESLLELQQTRGGAPGWLECEPENNRLYNFEANWVVAEAEGGKEGAGGTKKQSLGPDQLLLRGSSLRNTKWVLGMAVYTGRASKVMMNVTSAPRKVSQLEKLMNLLVMGMFAGMVGISAAFSIAHVLWSPASGRWYLSTSDWDWPELDPTTGAGALVHFLRYIILLNQMIPISLYVTLEMVKVIQSVYLTYDRQMYDQEHNQRFLVRTTTLNEELGQVEYILSDKTGTLTRNEMAFVQVSIADVMYGAGKKTLETPNRIVAGTPHLVCKDKELRALLDEGLNPSKSISPLAQATQDMFLHLVLSNTVLPSLDEENGSLMYQATSPDEEAIVEGAALCGFRLLERTKEEVAVEIHGRVMRFKVLAVLEFNSTRKRMSVIVQHPETGEVKLYCKGADSVIYERLHKSEFDRQQTKGRKHGRRRSTLMQTAENLQEYSRLGLRTLAFASKVIDQGDFQAWHKDYIQCSLALEDRDARLAASAENIEQDMFLEGAIAVEDKLQEGVPEAIRMLLAARCHVWMLTGDKMETAISIATSAALLDLNSTPIKFGAKGEEGSLEGNPALLRMHLERLKQQMQGGGGKGGGGAQSEMQAEEVRDFEEPRSGEEGGGGGGGGGTSTSRALVMDGASLAVALQPEHQTSLLELCSFCQAVICCRVSPLQKAEVTRLVKERIGAVTLAIGDGANDVGMIKAAHIGVGVSGVEGRQAVMAADYAVGQFRFLVRLLLYHGRYSYLRNKEVVMYAFYKNFAYCLANVWVSFFSGFSSQPIFSSALIASYNVLWTSFPTIAFAAFEKDVLEKTVWENPQLYLETSRASGRAFFRSMLGWLGTALWHSVAIFFGSVLGSAAATPDNGRIDGFYPVSVTVYTAVIVVVNLKLALRTHHWTWVSHFLVWGFSLGLWLPFVAYCSQLWTSSFEIFPEFYAIDRMLFPNPRFWLTVLVVSVAAISADLAFSVVVRVFNPKDSQIMQEVEQGYGRRSCKDPESGARVQYSSKASGRDAVESIGPRLDATEESRPSLVRVSSTTSSALDILEWVRESLQLSQTKGPPTQAGFDQWC